MVDFKKRLITAFKKHKDQILRYIYLRVGNSREIAQDITSEVFLKAWEKRESFDEDKGSMKTWLFTITRNKLIDYYRKKKPMSLKDGYKFNYAYIDDSSDEDILMDNILRSLNQLSPKERDLVILRYVEGLAISEVAEIIGKKYIATKIAIYRALNKLKKIVNEEHN